MRSGGSVPNKPLTTLEAQDCRSLTEVAILGAAWLLNDGAFFGNLIGAIRPNWLLFAPSWSRYSSKGL